jgi:pimeloyl-ACP methyl ester carboxylesterase
MMLDAKNAARLPRDVHRAFAKDDWSDFTHFAYTYGARDWGDQLMERVIRCSEKWAINSLAEVARLGAGTYVEGWYNQLADNHDFACKLTPIGETPEGMADQPPSEVPVLLFTGDADPQNPPENMALSKEMWPNSLLVVEPYQGHWHSDRSEVMCMWQIMTEFVENASVAGLHTECMQSVKPPAFLTD